MNEDVKKEYLDENGVLFYTQKLKIILDGLLAAKADASEITRIEGIIDTLETLVNNKVDKVTGKGLSTNDLTDALKQYYDNKQDALSAGSNISIENGVISATDTIYDDTEIKADIAELESGKVDKVTGKGLSTEDFTTAEKTKLSGIETGADVNVIESVKVNGSALTPDANKAVNVTVPTQVSDLTNDEDYQTGTEVAASIAAAIAGITSIEFRIVQELPAVGENGVIYLIQYAQTPEGNIYQEWIWIASSETYETLGSTNQIDLSNYLQKTDIIPVSNAEIETIYNRVFNSSNNNNNNNQEPEEEPGE